MVLDFCQVFGNRWVLAKKQHGHRLGGSTILRLCDTIIPYMIRPSKVSNVMNLGEACLGTWRLDNCWFWTERCQKCEGRFGSLWSCNQPLIQSRELYGRGNCPAEIVHVSEVPFVCESKHSATVSGPGKKRMNMPCKGCWFMSLIVTQYNSSKTCIQSCRCRSSAAFRGKETTGGCRAAWYCQTGRTFSRKMSVARKKRKKDKTWLRIQDDSRLDGFLIRNAWKPRPDLTKTGSGMLWPPSLNPSYGILNADLPTCKPDMSHWKAMKGLKGTRTSMHQRSGPSPTSGTCRQDLTRDIWHQGLWMHLWCIYI